MKVHKGYKTELKLNNKQRTACLQHAGAARFTYNWGLNQKKMAYENGETPNAIELHRRLNTLKERYIAQDDNQTDEKQVSDRH